MQIYVLRPKIKTNEDNVTDPISEKCIKGVKNRQYSTYLDQPDEKNANIVKAKIVIKGNSQLFSIKK